MEFRQRGGYAPTLNVGNISPDEVGFRCFPLSGSPLQTWILSQGILYSSLGFSIMCNPQILDIFLVFFNQNAQFNVFHHELAQYVFSLVMIIGVGYIVNGSDAFFNREIVPRHLPEMENLPHSHMLMSALNTSIIRLIFVPIIMIIILLTFGKQNVMITSLCVMFMIIEPIMAIITLYVIRRYPASDYPQYSAIILNINESDVDDGDFSESAKLVPSNTNQMAP